MKPFISKRSICYLCYPCRLDATIKVIRRRTIEYENGVNRVSAEIHVRKVPDDQQVSMLYYNSEARMGHKNVYSHLLTNWVDCWFTIEAHC